MRQHYVPKFIIEGFVDESSKGNRGVWVYEFQYHQWRKRPPRRTASLDDFYSLVEPDGDREDAIETALHETETPIALLIQKEIAERHEIASRPRVDDIFIVFCSMLIARNPSTVDKAKSAIEAFAQSVLDEVTSSAESFQRFRHDFHAKTGAVFPNVVQFERLRTDFKTTATKAGALVFAFATAEAFSKELAQMRVDFLFAPEHGPRFITGDVPFALVPLETNRSKLDQVILPLSSTLAAVFNATATPSYEYVDASPRVVMEINVAMLAVAERLIISASRDVFAEDILKEWAGADAKARFALILKLKDSSGGT